MSRLQQRPIRLAKTYKEAKYGNDKAEKCHLHPTRVDPF